MITTLPLFPLKLVLFPGGVLPLSIFEKRYVDMVRNCLRNKSDFVIVADLTDPSSLNHGHHPSLPFAEVGVMVEITDTNVTQPGLFDLRCLATQKIMVQSASQQEDGLWIGQVILLPSEPDIPLPNNIVAPKIYFEQLTNSLDEEAHTEEWSPFQIPYQFDSGTWLANRWSEILSIPLDEKQRLLELDSPLTRLRLINEMLTQSSANDRSFN